MQPLRLQHHRGGGVQRARTQLQGGHGSNEQARVVVLRALQHVCLAAHFHQVAQAQHGHALRHFSHHAKVVRDEEHPGAVLGLQGQDELENLRLRGDVQRGGGLVGNQEHGLQHQGHGDHDALALTATELVRVTRHHALGLGQQHFTHDVQDLDATFFQAQLCVLCQHFIDLVAASHHRVQRRHRLLKNHRHARGAQLTQAAHRRMRDVFALQQDLPTQHGQLVGQKAHHALGDD